MEREFGNLADGELLAVMSACLDTLFDDRLRLPSDAEQLALLRQAVRLGGRLQVWQERLAAGIEKSEAAWNERKTSTATWLAESLNLTTREAKRLVKAGQELERFPIVGAAAKAGEVLPSQAGAITQVLRDLPREFDEAAIRQGQEMMVEFAHSHNSVELQRLTAHLVEVLSPETADEIEAKRLERQEHRAQAHRFLEFKNDGDGSVLIRGSLPIAAAEPFIRIVDAYAAAEKRALEALDPNAEYVTPAMRRADGLLAMVHAHSQQALAPSQGGDRPRIVITLSYESLIKQCTDAGLGAELTRTGVKLPASAARQLLCDADILPAVLGGTSEPLDVGRAQRLVTPPIRAALELRDGGCIFPGCDKPPEACHAHHIQPWWAGGATSLSNLVLACPHHHGILEPGHDPTADRWQACIRDGRAEVIPPKRVDPRQRPRIHARFASRR
jgi:hypothetical protein